MVNPALNGDLRKAKIIVGAGRGIGDLEEFQQLVALAEILHAQVAGTRGAVEMGWLSHDREIGLSGQRVSPKLYLACGISGSNFHTIGLVGTDFLVAVNPDPDARIHQLAQIILFMDANKFIRQLAIHLQVVSFEEKHGCAVQAIKDYLDKLCS